MRGLNSAVRNLKQVPKAKKGFETYDNQRENIDPHIKTKVISTKEVDCTAFKLRTNPSNNDVLTADANGIGTWQAAAAGGTGSMTTVKEDGVQLGGADIVTLDFLGADFNLTESPDTEVNIVINDAGIDHDATTNFVANEHIDWTADQGATNIDNNNITSLPMANTAFAAGTNCTLSTNTLNVDDAFLLNNGDIGTGAFDFGGASSFEIPNSAGGGTIDAAGEVSIDTTSGNLNYHDGTAERALSPLKSRSITIENPDATEDLSIFFTNKAITITEIRAVLIGSSTPSVTWTIRHGTDRNAAGAEVVTSGTTTTSITTGSDVTSFNDATVIADSFLWLETTAKSGTVTELHVTIVYRNDA